MTRPDLASMRKHVADSVALIERYYTAQTPASEPTGGEVRLSMTRLYQDLEVLLDGIKTDWSDGVPNDGEYEYTGSSDCDGSNVRYFRRLPHMVLDLDPTTWTETPAIPADAKYIDGTLAVV